MKRNVLLLSLCFILIVSVFAACGGGGGGGGGGPDVVVAGKQSAEGAFMAEVFAQLLEEKTDLNIGRVNDLASRIAFQAVRDGEADIYPGYTGTMLVNYLGQDVVPGAPYAVIIERTRLGLLEEFDLVLLDSVGFQNTYRIAISREFAEENNIVTSSDLVPFAPYMAFGAEHDFFDRPDGFYAMSEAYGFEFARTMMMDIGLKYPSLNQGEIQAVIGYTTDGMISRFDLVLLEDDLMFFAPYYFHAVIRRDTLERFPQVGEALALLTGVATDADMSRFNYMIVSGQISMTDAATLFLQEFGIID